jgi:hypothetical protein
MQRLLLTNEVLAEDAAAMKSALEKRPQHMHPSPTNAESQSFKSNVDFDAVVALASALPATINSWMPPADSRAFASPALSVGPTSVSKMVTKLSSVASLDQLGQPPAMIRSQAPLSLAISVQIPNGSGFLIPVSPRASNTHLRAHTPIGRSSSTGFSIGEYVTEAPPADLLAECLSAGAAAANASPAALAAAQAAIAMRPSSMTGGARVRRDSSAASDLSSGGLSPLNRVNSHDNVAGIGVRTQRSAHSPSPGRPSVQLIPQTGKPRLRPPTGSRGSSAQPPAVPTSVTSVPSGASAPSSPPRLRGGGLQSVASMSGASMSTVQSSSRSNDTSPTRGAAPGVPSAVSPERAAALARRAARAKAAQRVSSLQNEFGALQSDTPVSIREACLAVCLAPMLQDACPEARHEAVIALGSFCLRSLHESGLVVAVAASLVDFATGGTCIRRVLRLPTGDSSASHGHPTGAASTSTPGVSQDPLSASSAMLAAAGGIRAAAVRKQNDAGSRARFNLLSRVFGGQSKASSSPPAIELGGNAPSVPAVSYSPSVSSPLARSASGFGAVPSQQGSSNMSNVCDFSVLGLPDGLLTLASISAVMFTASEAFRLSGVDPSQKTAGADSYHADEVRVDRSWLLAGAAGERDSVLQVGWEMALNFILTPPYIFPFGKLFFRVPLGLLSRTRCCRLAVRSTMDRRSCCHCRPM